MKSWFAKRWLAKSLLLAVNSGCIGFQTYILASMYLNGGQFLLYDYTFVLPIEVVSAAVLTVVDVAWTVRFLYDSMMREAVNP